MANSDLDLIMKGKSPAQLGIIDEMKSEFDSSSLPFIVHISDFYELDNDFLESIKSNMVEVL